MPAHRADRPHGTVTAEQLSTWVREHFAVGRARGRDRFAEQFPLDPDLDPEWARSAIAADRG